MFIVFKKRCLLLFCNTCEAVSYCYHALGLILWNGHVLSSMILVQFLLIYAEDKFC